jgi:hypothetical protein
MICLRFFFSLSCRQRNIRGKRRATPDLKQIAAKYVLTQNGLSGLFQKSDQFHNDCMFIYTALSIIAE